MAIHRVKGLQGLGGGTLDHHKREARDLNSSLKVPVELTAQINRVSRVASDTPKEMTARDLQVMEYALKDALRVEYDSSEEDHALNFGEDYQDDFLGRGMRDMIDDHVRTENPYKDHYSIDYENGGLEDLLQEMEH